MLRTWLERLVPTAIVAAVVGALFSQTRHFGLLGFDAYPILVTSRVASLGDLIGTFTERLMDGRYPGDFHRPLVNLSFAADHAVWGLDAFGYQLTGALLLAFAAGTLWALLRRLLGRDAWLGSVTGLLVFLLSAVQFEILPVPPRRPELLCCAFTALAVTLQLAPRALRSSTASWWPALATLLAIASKEPGYLVPLLCFVAVTMYSERKSRAERVRHALTAMVPHLVVVALMLLARFAVLRGIGGHGDTPLLDVLAKVPEALVVLGRELLWPQPVMLQPTLGRWLPAALLLAITVTLIRAVSRGRPGQGRAAVVGLVWIGLLGLSYAAAGLIGPWYLLLPLAGWALLAGAAAEWLFTLAGEDDRVLQITANAGLALLVGLLVWQCSYSPVFRYYDEWMRATAASEAFLEDTRLRIGGASPGSVVQAAPLPVWATPRPDGPAVRGAAILAAYSVQAWADLVLPERRVRVPRAALPPPPGPDEIVLVIATRAEIAAPE